MKNKTKKCCICGDDFVGWGNNPWPVVKDDEARCCDLCNLEYVIPSRIILLNNEKLNAKKED